MVTDFWSAINSRTDNVTIDIGANVGDYVDRLVGYSSIVYAFEPDPNNYQTLLNRKQKNFRWSNVEIFNKAIDGGSVTNRVKLFIDQGNIGGHTLNPMVPTLAEKNGWGHRLDNFIEVESISLDKFTDGKRIDVIKCDIEGGEDFIWYSAQRTLLNNKLDILLETHDHQTVNLEDLSDFFHGMGYQIWLDGPVDVMLQNKEYYITNR